MIQTVFSHHKKQAALALAACLLASGNFLSSAHAQKTAPAIGMPNPMVKYATIREASKAAGFPPLYLPEISGYHVTNAFVISKNTVDIRYARDGETNKTLTLRTSSAKRQQTKDISGIYGVKWIQRNIDDTTVFLAKVPAESAAYHEGYAAYWQQDGMLFSAYAQNISEPEFTYLLKDGLLDLSHIYF